jgi:cytochrome c-type biogenesis protein CcmH
MTALTKPTLRTSSDALLMVAVLVVAAAAIVAALGLRPPGPGERARRLESELRCPVCQGLSIAGSPAALAGEMRRIVAEQVSAGASDASVRAYFVERYGRWILLAPDPSGPNLLLWALPGVMLIGGAAAVVARSRQLQHRRTTRGPADGLAASTSRPLAVGLALGLVVLAVAIPMAVAVVPRSTGQEITGRPATQAAPSIEDLEARVTADPTDAGALVALGDAYADADRSTDAADAYGRALKVSPDDVGALVGLGGLLLGAGRPDGALALVDRAVTLAPELPDARLYRAIARFQLAGELTADARADVLRFLELAPDDPRRTLAEDLLAAPARSTAP